MGLPTGCCKQPVANKVGNWTFSVHSKQNTNVYQANRLSLLPIFDTTLRPKPKQFNVVKINETKTIYDWYSYKTIFYLQ